MVDYSPKIMVTYLILALLDWDGGVIDGSLCYFGMGGIGKLYPRKRVLNFVPEEWSRIDDTSLGLTTNQPVGVGI